MKVSEFITQLKKAASAKTLYVMGGFGAPAGYGNNRARYRSNNAYNRQPERQKKINAASADTYFFDCVGMVKGVLWGWNAQSTRVYGGADYGSNGVPDYDAKQMMFSGCKDPSTDMSKIEPGEFLWFDGHCGVYLGEGKTIESTPNWEDGVQIRNFDSRWTHRGHLKYVEYCAQPVPGPDEYMPGSIYQVVCKGPLRIRRNSNTSSEIIDNLYKGNQVLVDDCIHDKDGNVWLKVTGYVAAKYDGDTYIG